MVDDVCLDVLVSWLLGRSFIFSLGTLLCVFPSQTGPSPFINQDITFLIFVPPTGQITVQNPVSYRPNLAPPASKVGDTRVCASCPWIELTAQYE